MQVVCAWCQTSMGSTVGGDPDDVSHGICPSCEEYFLDNRAGRTLEEFLETVPPPVLVVDETGRILTGNAAALSMLQKPVEQIAGQLGGDVLECAYARLPGGCGETEHCVACGIRNTVMRAHETGLPQIGVTVYQELRRGGRTQPVRFRITTTKRDRVVLLRVDGAEAEGDSAA